MDPQAAHPEQVLPILETPEALEVCPSCHMPILPHWYFCPNCGKKLKNPPLSTGVGRQIYVYLMSIFLPPSGIIYGIRYFKQGDTKSLIVGFVAMVLTVIVIVYTIILTMQLVRQFQGIVNNQLNLPTTQSIFNGTP